MKKYFRPLCLLLALTALCALTAAPGKAQAKEQANYIKWVDCTVKEEVLKKAYRLDVKYRHTDVDFSFVKALAYLAVKNGNNFSASKDTAALDALARELEAGKKLDDYYGENKYYKYYVESYGAIFNGMVGAYTEGEEDEIKYGLTAYFPFARGYWFTHYDDFGNSRSFGFRRKHLGHDLMGAVGTPIAAVEGGTVQELGWNRYGGWRVGIRSRDAKRYYYYAHLRKDRPYAAGLKKGDTVEAGQIIGYLGNTGYSDKENQNLSSCSPHLHFGMQIIFDESQVQGNNEIWIDVYEICKFLSQNRVRTEKDAETKEYRSVGLRRPFMQGAVPPPEDETGTN